MSYILDALKKADQQRRRAETPTLRSAPEIALETRKTSAWRYAVLALVLIGIGTLVGWLQTRQSSDRSGNQTVASTMTPPSRVVPQAPPTQLSPAMPSTPAPPLPLPSAMPTRPVPHASARAAQPDAAPAAVEPQQGRIFAMDALPLPVRQSLPEMTVSLHAWSAAPKSRLVSINNKVLHEGDSPAAGVTLEEITPDGMIMSFRGYRFRKGVR